MFSGPKSGWRRTSLALAVVVSFQAVSAQQPGPTDETIAAPIMVRASSSAAQTATDRFLTSFITTAVRLEGLKFFACVTTASTLRPDLAGKIVICSLNLLHLNSNLADGRLSLAVIDQVVKAAVTAAPQSAADIVKAAIESEPYARTGIIAAAVAAAPNQATHIYSAASQSQPMTMFASAAPAALNPVNNGGVGPVNSPEQPPAGP
jgi:hypothetical protein